MHIYSPHHHSFKSNDLQEFSVLIVFDILNLKQIKMSISKVIVHVIMIYLGINP